MSESIKSFLSLFITQEDTNPFICVNAGLPEDPTPTKVVQGPPVRDSGLHTTRPLRDLVVCPPLPEGLLLPPTGSVP